MFTHCQIPCPPDSGIGVSCIVHQTRRQGLPACIFRNKRGNIGSGFVCLARRYAFLPGRYKLDISISFSMLTICEPFKEHLCHESLSSSSSCCSLYGTWPSSSCTSCSVSSRTLSIFSTSSSSSWPLEYIFSPSIMRPFSTILA